MSKITIPGNSILLLEGGSLRGLYTAGVLDTFMENDLYFPAVAGVSAGSLNAMNYVSHQPGRSASINLRYSHDPRNCNLCCTTSKKKCRSTRRCSGTVVCG